MVDGHFLREMPIKAVPRSCSKDVSVLIGATAEQAKLFVAMWPGMTNISDNAAARSIC